MKRVYQSHKLIRLVSAGAIATMLGGVASADSVTITDTGFDSNQTTTINNTNISTVNNTNEIHIMNVNDQVAKTGDVKAADNTNVGNVGSGAASNNNDTTTDVSVNNDAVGGLGGGNGSGGNGSGGGNVGGSGGGSGSGPVGGRGGGSALGAATGGLGAGSGSVLPEVGASSPIDLSALRSLYTNGNSGGLAAGSKGLDLGYMIPAFLLSALAGIGTVIRQKRRELVKA